MHKNIFQEINFRFGPRSYIANNNFLSIAILLDPRFKKIHFRSAIKCSYAINTVFKLLRNIHDNNNNNNNKETTGKSLRNDVDENNDNLWNIHEEIKAFVAIFNDESTSIPTELRQYLNSALLDRKDDPLKNWLKVKDVYPNIYKIAIKYNIL